MSGDVAYVERLGPEFCHCGDRECWHWSPSYYGYLFCRPCEEHHRPPECAVDEQGRAVRFGMLLDEVEEQ